MHHTDKKQGWYFFLIIPLHGWLYNLCLGFNTFKSRRLIKYRLRRFGLRGVTTLVYFAWVWTLKHSFSSWSSYLISCPFRATCRLAFVHMSNVKMEKKRLKGEKKKRSETELGKIRIPFLKQRNSACDGLLTSTAFLWTALKQMLQGSNHSVLVGEGGVYVCMCVCKRERLNNAAAGLLVMSSRTKWKGVPAAL